MLGRDAKEGDDRLEEAQLRLGRIARIAQCIGLELRKQVGELAAQGAKLSAHLLEIGRAQVVAKRLEEREIWQCEVRLRAATRKRRHPDFAGPALQLGGPSALAA